MITIFPLSPIWSSQPILVIRQSTQLPSIHGEGEKDQPTSSRFRTHSQFINHSQRYSIAIVYSYRNSSYYSRWFYTHPSLSEQPCNAVSMIIVLIPNKENYTASSLEISNLRDLKERFLDSREQQVIIPAIIITKPLSVIDYNRWYSFRDMDFG